MDAASNQKMKSNGVERPPVQDQPPDDDDDEEMSVPPHSVQAEEAVLGSVLKRGPCLVLDLTLRVLFCFLLTLGLLARRLLELTVLCGAVFFPLRLTGSSPEMAPATPCRNPKISAFVPLAPMTTMRDKAHRLVIPTCYQCQEITVTVSPTMEKVRKEPSRRSPVSTSLQLGCRNSRTSA